MGNTSILVIIVQKRQQSQKSYDERFVLLYFFIFIKRNESRRAELIHFIFFVMLSREESLDNICFNITKKKVTQLHGLCVILTMEAHYTVASLILTVAYRLLIKAGLLRYKQYANTLKIISLCQNSTLYLIRHSSVNLIVGLYI